MTEPKKFSRGKHTYTRWGHNFKEVKVEGKAKPNTEEAKKTNSLSVDINKETAMGVYANGVMLHQSPTECVLDFLFVPPGQNRGRLRSRVVLPPKQIAQLSKMLNKVMESQAGKSI